MLRIVWIWCWCRISGINGSCASLWWGRLSWASLQTILPMQFMLCIHTIHTYNNMCVFGEFYDTLLILLFFRCVMHAKYLFELLAGRCCCLLVVFFSSASQWNYRLFLCLNANALRKDTYLFKTTELNLYTHIH